MVALGGGPNPQLQQIRGQHLQSKSVQLKTEIDYETTTATLSDDLSEATSPIDTLRAAPFSLNYHPDLPLLKESTHRHIERVFTSLRGREGDYITRENLEEFLAESQGGLVRPLEKDKYNVGDFVYVWLHDYSVALKPAAKKDLSKPITNYFISSSHNTYIGMGNQLSGEVSADAYRTVLEGDCRCVEIDVWNGEGYTERPRTPTPSRSKSPRRDVHRHNRNASTLSTSSIHSLPAAAQSFADKIDQKWHELSTRRHDRKGTSKFSLASASLSSLHLALPAASYSSTSLDPNDLSPPLRHVCSAEGLRLKAQESSRSRSRSRSREPRGRKIEPEVTHAHTVQGLGDVGLAKRIPLREVCRVIKESAFKTNKLPLVISLEVHATGEQQDMIVDIMKEEWGDHLVDEPLEGCDPGARQPRLEELMEKILVKVKKAAPKGYTMHKGSSQLTVPTSTFHDEDGSASEDERLSVAGEIRTETGELAQMVKASKSLIRETLGKLAIYTHSEHYKDFSAPAAKSPSHIFSIDEYKILKLHQSKHREMFIHNRDYFMRAYPHSTRVSSTNLDPSIYWRKGVQMVALNWQRAHVDEAIMLNSAMFESEQGWALKPQGYLSGDETSSQAEAGKRRALMLTVKILAGQLLPLPGEPDDGNSNASTVSSVSTSDSTAFQPLVKCELHVETPEELTEKKAIKSGYVQDGQYKLQTRSSETENPDWGMGQELKFPRIDKVVEELSFVRFKIEDEGLVKDRLAAWACIRLDRLQSGYRFIDLKDAHGRPSAGKLLVNIEKKFR
ncbi:phosphatidylinositol-specific phospholipase C [Diaporthe helianthi]|uniref:Phosphoinositide phospholipase C n=1 Tax=Diaporthe helianthi TaxID=158607 RepID=A0A2P5HYA5_DIAHE|nr:phosphatidylinositol-specific phospholipase C [Diaporthe helianthi]